MRGIALKHALGNKQKYHTKKHYTLYTLIPQHYYKYNFLST